MSEISAMDWAQHIKMDYAQNLRKDSEMAKKKTLTKLYRVCQLISQIYNTRNLQQFHQI